MKRKGSYCPLNNKCHTRWAGTALFHTGSGVASHYNECYVVFVVFKEYKYFTVAEILDEEYVYLFFIFPHEMYFDASILSEPPALLPYSCHLYSQVIISCIAR